MSETPDYPLGLLAEVTHRCPLSCSYCSNPLELVRAAGELSTAEWMRVLDEAAALGVLQVHFSGGEPLARRDLADLVGHASKAGLYGNLITSGLGLTLERMKTLVDAGLPHIQLSLQDADAGSGDTIAGMDGAHAAKRNAADIIARSGLPLTINAVIHRQNIDRVAAIVQLAQEWGASRLELAHAQYAGWALRNRAFLIPSLEQVRDADALVAQAQRRLAGILAIDYVAADHHRGLPKSCMGGWGRKFIAVTPDGAVLPCHSAQTLPGFEFPNVRGRSLSEIWFGSDAFNRFRGTGWMPAICAGCEHKERDWGGCRCQAFALTGDAANIDPACWKSPDHHLVNISPQPGQPAARAYARETIPIGRG